MLEETIKNLFNRHERQECPTDELTADDSCANDDCAECFTGYAVTAITAAGYVLRAKDQTLPVNEMCFAPNDDWEQAQKLILTHTPDPDNPGNELVWMRVSVPEEEVEDEMGRLDHDCDKCTGFKHCIANGYIRRDFLKLPVEERRGILKRQVAELLDKQALEDKKSN